MLIADYDPVLVKLLAEKRTNAGFKVETAINGIQALVKARRSQPDILVIDVNMPDADGLSVCTHLLDPSRRPLSVVVVAWSLDPVTAERCKGFGAHYTRKGSKFWSCLASELTRVFPEMADRLTELGLQRWGAEVSNRPRVLVVDDDTSIEVFLSASLGKFGVDILYAPDALQGYRIACRDEPAVIISDYFMPTGNADFFLSKLRSSPETERIPVIVLSGTQLDPSTTETLMRDIGGKPGASSVLKKSFDTRELFEILQRFCGFGQTVVAPACH
jgi:CheY-like chemotaxis protein